jgi:tripartite-type tricarboxylate transporter receptor subunit TctC
LVAALAFAANAAAQDYPSRPLRLITQFSPGSSGDVVVRTLATHLSPLLSQPVVVENRSGAGGVQAAEAGAHAAPDGYTLLAISPAVPVVRVAAGTPISIDPTRDLAPLTMVAVTPSVIVSHPSVPVSSFAELLEYAKKNPGKLTFSTTGVGSPHHLAAEQIRLLTGVEMVHVPYKGGVASMTDLVAGRLDVAYVILGDAAPHLRAGKARLLATREAKRLRQFPDIPKVGDVVPKFEAMPGWTSLFAPTGVPQPISRRVYTDVVKALSVPEAVERITQAGFEVAHNATPEEFAAQVKREIELVSRLARAANIKLE